MYSCVLGLQVIGGAEKAEKAMSEAREAAAASRTMLSQRRESSSALQGALREKSRSVEMAVTKLREVNPPAILLRNAARCLLRVGESRSVVCFSCREGWWGVGPAGLAVGVRNCIDCVLACKTHSFRCWRPRKSLCFLRQRSPRPDLSNTSLLQKNNLLFSTHDVITPAPLPASRPLPQPLPPLARCRPPPPRTLSSATRRSP